MFTRGKCADARTPSPGPLCVPGIVAPRPAILRLGRHAQVFARARSAVRREIHATVFAIVRAIVMDRPRQPPALPPHSPPACSRRAGIRPAAHMPPAGRTREAVDLHCPTHMLCSRSRGRAGPGRGGRCGRRRYGVTARARRPGPRQQVFSAAAGSAGLNRGRPVAPGSGSGQLERSVFPPKEFQPEIRLWRLTLEPIGRYMPGRKGTRPDQHASLGTGPSRPVGGT